jgi:hypothetical protein
MCLTIKRNQKAKIAEEDIIVYKQITRIKDHPRTYLSFYRKASVILGKTYISGLTKEDYDGVSEGLHSFESMERTIEDIKESPEYPNQGVIVRCIIPKGSKYYKGTFCNMVGYASNTIVYTKEIVYEEKMN